MMLMTLTPRRGVGVKRLTLTLNTIYNSISLASATSHYVHAHHNHIQESVIWFSFPEFLPHQVVAETLPHYLAACCWEPGFAIRFSKRFSCASHL